MINGTNVNDLMDPKLEGNFSTAEATVVFKLASQCLQHNDRESLNTNDLVAVLEPLQTRTQVRNGLLINFNCILVFFIHSCLY